MGFWSQGAPRLCLALLIGSTGGWLAFTAALPLPWMIGAMTATTLAAVAGAPLMMVSVFRTVMVAVLGVMLGSGFAPEMLEQLANWAVTLSALLPYVALAGGMALFYYRRRAGYDRVTAYFSAMPGGLNEMILIGAALGGDERRISLSHAARILIVVMILAFSYRWFFGNSGAATNGPVTASLMDAGLTVKDTAILAACGLFGYLLARLAKLPAAAVLGPMVLSGLVHLGGLTAARPPVELSAAAQVVLGTALGCRFVGTAPSEVLDALRRGFVATLLLLAATLVFAFALAGLTGLPMAALILAYAPGGLAEMSILALALGIDPAFVATHHVVRIFMIVVLAPLCFKWLR